MTSNEKRDGGTMAGAEVARVDNSFINRLQPEIARAIPKTMDADRIARIAMTLVRQSIVQAEKDGNRDASLAVCTPDSFAGALLTASALGLEPGINGEAYLVPYKRECTLIVGYQGLTKLFWQHPLAHYLDAHAVHENDTFDYAYGLDQFLTHRPAHGDRGPVVSYWAAGKLSSGASRFVVLTADEVRKLRGGKVGPSGRIADPMMWMERKTALRQLLKLMPKSVTMAAAIAVDEQRGSVLAARGVPSSIANQEPIAELPPAMDGPEQHSQRVTVEELTAVPVATQTPSGNVPVVNGTTKPAAVNEQSAAEPMVSGGQLDRLADALAKVGVNERVDRLATVSKLAGCPLETSSHLTAAKADEVIVTLERLGQRPEPARELDAYLANLDEGDSEVRE